MVYFRHNGDGGAFRSLDESGYPTVRWLAALCITLDVAASQALQAVGYLKGVG